MIESNPPLEVAVDRDLYCMQCGYNLRGLPGDPKRCPECGHANPLGLLLVPAETISDHLRRLETAPTLCIGCLVALVLGAAQMILLVFNKEFDEEARVVFLGMALVMLAFGVIGWPLCMLRFAKSCEFKRGWQRALVNFHLRSVLVFVVGYGTLIGAPALCVFFSRVLGLGRVRSNWSWGLKLVCVIVFGLVVAVAGFRATRRLYLWAKGDFAPLQRAVAVALANRG